MFIVAQETERFKRLDCFKKDFPNQTGKVPVYLNVFAIGGEFFESTV